MNYIEQLRTRLQSNIAIGVAILVLLTQGVDCQQLDLPFDFPFRLKHLYSSETGGWWSVGGSGSLTHSLRTKRITTKVSNVDLNAVFFPAAHTGVLVGNGGEILVSANGGKSWKKQTSGVKSDLRSVYCVDVDICWIASSENGALLKGSPISGWTVEKVVPDGSFEDIYFANKSIGFAVGQEGLFLKTEDGGETWTRINIPAILKVSQFVDGIPNFEAVSFFDERIGCVAGWDVGTGIVACSADSGATWKVSYLSVQPFGIIWQRRDRVFLIDRYGKNLESNDLGKTWNSVKKLP